MAKEYIEREAAIRVATTTSPMMPTQWLAIQHALEAIPAADVQEVVRGEWKPVMERWNKKSQAAEEWYGYLFFCDKCGGTAMYRPNYCPNCGAEMRGEEDG